MFGESDDPIPNNPTPERQQRLVDLSINISSSQSIADEKQLQNRVIRLNEQRMRKFDKMWKNL